MTEKSRVRRYWIVSALFLTCLSAPMAMASINTLPGHSAPTAVERLVKTVRSLLGMFDNKAPEQARSGVAVGTTSQKESTFKANDSGNVEGTEGPCEDNIGNPPTGMAFELHPSG